ncbi:MAG: hypothetical protein JWQ35_1253, partial [Bacteriovoracaceae bacterium]|nr:hypothetical protein [Bacteriovoracaceae bacterium]
MYKQRSNFISASVALVMFLELILSPASADPKENFLTPWGKKVVTVASISLACGVALLGLGLSVNWKELAHRRHTFAHVGNISLISH